MAFYEDAEQAKDKQSVKDWKTSFDSIIQRANLYIDRITNERYGALSDYVTQVNLLKSHMEALKIKYNLSAVNTELDGFIATVDAEISAVQDRWNTEVYNKLNG